MIAADRAEVLRGHQRQKVATVTALQDRARCKTALQGEYDFAIAFDLGGLLRFGSGAPAREIFWSLCHLDECVLQTGG